MIMQYVTGGTMLAQSPTYVERISDHVLREKLSQGEFCYVLTPRQMGKSSLMIKTADVLRKQGIVTAILDLSRQGYTSNETQWYNGLQETLAEHLDIEAEMDAFRRAHLHDNPLQRWQHALRRVILECIPSQIVIFVDEIDIMQRLSFETDQFFAAIRACYNARAYDSAFRRLTFCLLGVATPADLITDPLLTPFNIGTRVDLHDFTLAEASQLGFGLGHDPGTNQFLIERIHYWTAGHPCLTQRLCQAVADDGSILTHDGVDACCRRLFLTSESEFRDDNLMHIRQRILSGDNRESTSLLLLYRRVLDGKRVADQETDVVVSKLKMSGVVSVANRQLCARNRIYESVFDRQWIATHLPGEEKRRQQAAYRRGALRAVSILSVVTALMGVMTLRVIRSEAGLRQALQSVRVERDQNQLLLYL